MNDPIAYSYEADYHCPGCTFKAFGQDEHGFPPMSSRDGEGNPISPLFPWDEWYEINLNGDGTTVRQVLRCGSCDGIISTVDA